MRNFNDYIDIPNTKLPKAKLYFVQYLVKVSNKDGELEWKVVGSTEIFDTLCGEVTSIHRKAFLNAPNEKCRVADRITYSEVL